MEDVEVLFYFACLRRKRHLQNILRMLLLRRQLVSTKRTHRFWVHRILRRRLRQGAYHHLVRELQLDREKYHEYLRMSPEKLEYILGHVGPLITKQTLIREPLGAKQRLIICIRFLATGETYSSLAGQYRVGLTTISNLVPEVCRAIWLTLQPVVMKIPQTAEEWQIIAKEFEQRWNYPHCVGAVDGKHVVIRSPAHSGSVYYNYKGTFSVVLMALVDASYKFISVDIGSYGRQSDAGIFAHSNLGEALLPPSSLNLPDDTIITGAEQLGNVPYVVVGDEAFPLHKHVMRPYPGRNCTEAQQIYNYRHSRARRIVECAFGILVARWRIFHTKISVLPETANSIIQATTVLHNLLQRDSTPAATAELIHDVQQDVQGLEGLRRLGTRGTQEATDIRDTFKDYFLAFPLPWQAEYVKRGLYDA